MLVLILNLSTSIMPRSKYTTTIRLTDKNFQPLSLRESPGVAPSTSPNTPPFRGVHVHADRRRSLDHVCPACSLLLLREDTLGLFSKPQGTAEKSTGLLSRVHTIPKESFYITA